MALIVALSLDDVNCGRFLAHSAIIWAMSTIKTPRMRRVLRFGWGFFLAALLTLSLAALIASVWPQPRQTIALDVAIEGTIRQLLLDVPVRMRLGQTAEVVFQVIPVKEEAALTKTSALLSAGLDLPGFQLQPGAVQEQSLLPNQANRFTWQVLAVQAGLVRGSLPLSRVRFEGDQVSGQRTLLAAQSFQIEVIDLLGRGQFEVRLMAVFFGLLSASGLVVTVLFRKDDHA